MSVRNTKDGSKKPWLAEVYPEGRGGPRMRKKFATKGEAMAWERDACGTPLQSPGDERTLSDLVERWYALHGQSLKDGSARKSKLLHIAEALGDPVATDFSVKDFSVYREKRLSGEINDKRAIRTEKGVSVTSVNRDHAYLRAVFNELTRLGEWPHPNPLDGLRAYRQTESELAFLYEGEIIRLLTACANSTNRDLLIIVKLCLATGARWSEIEQLKQSQVSNGRITFTKTKSNKSRTVPISDELLTELPKRRGRLFSDCYKAFTKAIDEAGIQLPDGQHTHVLRHTFASHFMMNGGNILVLQKILGHSTITMTMRYAHFAPDHLEDAVRFNPISMLKNGGKVAAEII